MPAPQGIIWKMSGPLASGRYGASLPGRIGTKQWRLRVPPRGLESMISSHHPVTNNSLSKRWLRKLKVLREPVVTGKKRILCWHQSDADRKGPYPRKCRICLDRTAVPFCVLCGTKTQELLRNGQLFIPSGRVMGGHLRALYGLGWWPAFGIGCRRLVLRTGVVLVDCGSKMQKILHSITIGCSQVFQRGGDS